MLSWQFIRNYFFSKRAGSVIRTVTWIGVVSVGLGVFSFIVVLSVMNGFNDSMKDKMLAVEPHLVVRFKDLSEAQALQNPEIVELKKAGARIDYYEAQDVIVRTQDGFFGGGVLRSVDSDTLKNIYRQAEAPVIPQGEVLMGVELGRMLRVLDGDFITLVAPESMLSANDFSIPFEKVRVRLVSTQVPEVDTRIIFYDRLNSFANFRKSLSHESGIEVRLKDANNYLPIQKKLTAAGLQTESWVDRNSSLFFALKVEKSTMGFLLAMSALIASFSLVTVLILVITLKRRDIGILMALGLSPKATVGLFLRMGWFLSLIGMGWGLVLGIAVVVYLQNYPLPILPDIYYETTIPARLDLWLVMGTIAIAMAVVSIAAWIPTRVLMRLSPVVLIRQTGTSNSRNASLSDVF